jgi:hypothetical protein
VPIDFSKITAGGSSTLITRRDVFASLANRPTSGAQSRRRFHPLLQHVKDAWIAAV